MTQSTRKNVNKKAENKKGKILDRFRIRISDQEFTIEIFNQDLADEELKKYSVYVNGTLYTVEVEQLDIDSGYGPTLTGTTAVRPTSKEPVIDKVDGEPPSKLTPIEKSIPEPKTVDEPKAAATEHITSTGGENTLFAPMPGKILEIKVKIGDHVEAGQPLVILEAMKMENVMTAPATGTVKEIPTKVGVNVNQGDSLVIIE